MQRRQLEKYMRILGCGACNGQRLNPQARCVSLTTRSPMFRDNPEHTLPEVCALPVTEAEEFFRELELDATGQAIAAEALKEIRGRLQFLKNVGLDYLTLDRTAPTLSGGEMQRIRLAGQIGCGLVGVLYILDEPSVGLHPRDNDRLLAHPGQPPRSRQHGRGGRARRRHHARRRSHRRFRTRPRRSRRADRRHRSVPANRRPSGQRHRAISFRPAADRNPRPTPTHKREKTRRPQRHAQ